MLTCPNDGTALTQIQVENVPVDQCSACGGQWLQRGELETLSEHHKAHLEPIVVGRINLMHSKRKCPADGTMMTQHEFMEHTGIKIDQCPTCQGIWLDKAELATMLSYLDTEGVQIEPTLSQRVMLFLYDLVKEPPYY
jgi:Zn-finger nucleic acid-binding protein